jgi:hypothetical protein
MDSIEPVEPRLATIQYAADVETGIRRGRLQRLDSTASARSRSLSIHSITRHPSVDPATLIPIEYRTVYVFVSASVFD